MDAELTVAPLDRLRGRRSVKWRTFPDDVLPLFVAEMDYDLAPPVAEALHQAIERSDLGYAATAPELGPAVAGFAARHWGWEIDPAQVTGVTDVGLGVIELLRVLTRPGDVVAISPPVYPPFFVWAGEAAGRLLEVPLAHDVLGYHLDLAAIEAAFATHPAAYLLSNPHNPVGRVHTPAELAALVRLARLYQVTIISDEIHAPLVLPGATFTPLLTVPGAAEVAVSVVSASKAFNLAGLKCAAVVTASRRMAEATGRFPRDTEGRTGHLGVLATVAAFTAGDEWLAALIRTLDARRAQLGDLLREHLPAVRWTPPQATYLAWLDCTAFGTDTEPRDAFLDRGRVAVEPGTRFGALGAGHVRLNFATGPEILDEALTRMAASIRG
jgi:cysteine-S-conjugate beta-lyase